VRYFNAFQLVILFACFPFIINWLHKGTFVGSYPLMWVAIAAYVIEFIFLVGFVAEEIKGT
jgi:uncharacterized SAM-binding protein YcdF (DUF218 family)